MSKDYSQDFGPFGGRTWLNCAHQGPLPRRSVAEAHEAIAWKISPHELTAERFSGVPSRLKRALGKLIGVPADEVVLGNSASYGLHLVANGMPWQSGDQVLLVEGDFPSDILPWLALERRGVQVRRVQARRHVLEPDELETHLTPATRLFCTTWGTLVLRAERQHRDARAHLCCPWRNVCGQRFASAGRPAC